VDSYLFKFSHHHDLVGCYLTLGSVEILAFMGSAEVGNARWQVNVVLSVLYVVGIGLAGYGLFKRQTLDARIKQSGPLP